jgi:putative transposase
MPVAQYTSIAYTDRLDEIGAAPSIGTIGDSFDNAMAETTIGLFKTELHRNPAALARNGGPWRGLDDLDIATCGSVSWFKRGAPSRRVRRPDPVRVRGRAPSRL